MQFLTDNFTVIHIAISILITIAILITILSKAYAESPAWQNKATLIIAIALIPVSASFTHLTYEILVSITLTGTPAIHQLGLIPSSMITYCLMSAAAIFFIAYEKKGFDNMKGILENGILNGFIVGLAIMSLGGVLGGATNAMVGGMVGGMIDWIVNGMSLGVVIALPIALLFEVVSGSIDEYDYKIKQFFSH